MTFQAKGSDPDMPYNAQINRLPIFALFDLKGPADMLANWADVLPPSPNTPNTLARSDGTELFHIGPDRYLLRAPIEQEASLEDALRPQAAPPDISIVRVSDTQTFFRITGPDADQVVSIGCPLDLHPGVFGPDTVSNTEFFGIKALILRCDGGLDIAVEQSFGDMIEDYLSRSMA